MPKLIDHNFVEDENVFFEDINEFDKYVDSIDTVIED